MLVLSNVTRSCCIWLQSTASSTKQAITNAVVLLAGALQTLGITSAEGANISNLIVNINGLETVPTATVQNLTGKISGLTVAPDKVASVTAVAKQNLGIANDVVQSTLSAQ